MGHRTRKRISAPTVIQEIEFAPDSPQERTGFEPSVPPRKRQPSREAPRPTIVVSRDDLCLMTPSSLSVRRLSSATAERPFTRAGPMVRIRFPPAVSQANFRIAAAGSTRIAFSAWRVPPSCRCGVDRAAPRRLRQPGAGTRAGSTLCAGCVDAPKRPGLGTEIYRQASTLNWLRTCAG